ncbi:hypothetical protein [Antrihabitans stalagmiti]|uniref:hypothetical protein n=1 Tax=Antrihabitans stalagmiti TaxID=2799499 RepID=UPI0027DB4161|nr:hypothetical protein [Antrihabitans stalagmiti]
MQYSSRADETRDGHRSPAANQALLLSLNGPETAPSKPDHSIVREWIPIVTFGESVGFSIPAVVGIATAAAPAAVALPALVVAGAAEGAVLGLAQATVLRRALPDLSRTRWVLSTAAAAAFAYTLGMAPSTWASPITRWPPVATVAVVSLLAVAVLLSIGTAQYSVLRNVAANAGHWIWITALAWLAGLAVFMGVATPLWHEGQSAPLAIGIGLLGGLFMAATTSTLTGLGLRLILPLSTLHRR